MRHPGSTWSLRRVLAVALIALFPTLLSAGDALAQTSPTADGPVSHQVLKDRLKVAGGKLEVVIEGIVANQVDTPDDTFKVRAYNLRDVKGVLMLVRTTSALPFPNTRIRVTGVAMIDREPPFANLPFVLESERLVMPLETEAEITGTKRLLVPKQLFETSGPSVPKGEPLADVAVREESRVTTSSSTTKGAEAVAAKAVPVATPTVESGLLFGLSGYWLLAISALSVAFIAGAVMLGLSRGNAKKPPVGASGLGLDGWQSSYRGTSTPAAPDPVDLLHPGVARHAAPAVSTAPAPPAAEPQTFEDYKTVRAFKTTKSLPGRLVVLDGERETDVIHLSDQTGRGEIEIGRDSPDSNGGIRIKDKTNTMSRKQGKLSYDAAKREFTFLNYVGDAGNPTSHNKRLMHENQAVVLTDGDVLNMGNVDLRFRQK